jgi:hypothetical protein
MSRIDEEPVDLTHHALHALGSRLLGFSPELFDDSAAFADGPEVLALSAHRMAGDVPNLAEMLLAISHDEATVVGSGCDRHRRGRMLRIRDGVGRRWHEGCQMA